MGLGTRSVMGRTVDGYLSTVLLYILSYMYVYVCVCVCVCLAYNIVLTTVNQQTLLGSAEAPVLLC